VATAATRQSETELSYTYRAIRAQAAERIYLRAPPAAGTATSCQIFTFLGSFNRIEPITKVMAAMVIG
jgi:hypothetical protein